MSQPFHHRAFQAQIAGTEPPTPASFAIGFSHAQIRTAIADLESGRTAFALSALQTTLAMLDSAMVPELRLLAPVGGGDG